MRKNIRRLSLWEKFALILTIALCGMGLYLVLASKLRIDSADSFIGAAIGFVWLCILFLPALHERYTYPLDILLLILAAVDRKYLKYAVVSELLSLSTCGAYPIFYILCRIMTSCASAIEETEQYDKVRV